MQLELLIFVSCIPIILMCAYIYSKDADKEPSSTLRRLFIYGIISIVPIILLELLTNKIVVLDKDNLASLFINTFVTVGLIEEGTKWVIINKSIYGDKEFNHAYDAILYSVFASLGFALVENLIYVLQDGVVVGLLRAITTIPLHTFNGIIMGYYLGLAKKEDISNNKVYAKKYMFLSLLMPILAHTFYDFFIFIEKTPATYMFIFFVITMYIISYIILRNISIIRTNFDGSRFDAKRKKEYSVDKEIFTYALSNVLLITLILILLAALIIILHLI